MRNLEREIGNLCRKVAKTVVCGETKKVSITGRKVEEMLGKKRFRFDIIKGEKGSWRDHPDWHGL